MNRITTTPIDAGAPTPAEAGERLTREQLGHIRHLQNIAALPDNDWSGMQQGFPAQDDGATYRFQLAYGAYALALTHAHRLPAAPGVFKPIFKRFTEKMLLPEVWMYWQNVSQGGGIDNPHIHRDPEWDPVARDNIMYSSYLQSMVTMFEYLFDDQRFAAPEALTIEHYSPFWGGPGLRFTYDRDSITEQLYWQLVKNGYLGIACYPNCIYQVCNQPAILGFRMHDLVTGGSRAAEVTQNFERVWEDFGQFDENGHYTMFAREDTRDGASGNPAMDAWLAGLMNMWNPQLAHERYPDQIRDVLYELPDGTVTLKPSPPPPGFGGVPINFHGFFSMTASELGDEQTLCGLLGFADTHLNPTWRDGGLFYPRNDERLDPDGHPSVVDPLTGNVLVGYARLNTPNGLWRLYNTPWPAGHHQNPALTRVARNVDVSRAIYDPEAGILKFTVQRRADLTSSRDLHDPDQGTVEITRLATHGTWVLRQAGEVINTGDSDTATVVCPDDETDFELTVSHS